MTIPAGLSQADGIKEMASPLIRRPCVFLARLPLCAALIGAALTPGLAQQPEMDGLAARVAKGIAKSGKKKVIVADFVGPKDLVNDLGRWLAEELSGALAKVGGDIQVLPRKGLKVSTARKMSVTPEIVEGFNRESFVKLAGAEILVSGSLKLSKDSVRVIVRVWDMRAARVSGDAWEPKMLDDISLKIPMTTAMEELLAKPLPPARPGTVQLSAGLKREREIVEETKQLTRRKADEDACVESDSGATEAVFRPGENGVGYPSCAHCPDPDYSPEARKKKLEGSVALAVTITPQGVVTDIVVLRRAGYGLDEKAVEAVREWKFKPATGPDGKPVFVRVPIEIMFRFFP